MLALSAAALLAGCFPELPLGTPGHWDYQSLAAIGVPGATFNAAALNTRFEHEAFSIDTKVGPRKTFVQVYNTGTRRWRGSWEMHYDGTTFVDQLGTVHDVGGASPGSAIRGSYWVVVDADTVKTKGGLTYHFDASGRLAAETWSRDAFPQLAYTWDADSVQVEECVSSAQQQSGQCRLIATVHYGPEGAVEIVDEVSAAAGDARRALYTHDGAGRVLEARTPRQVADGLPGTRFEYDPPGLPSAQVLPDGERIEYVYAQTHLYEVRQIGEGDPVHRLEYYGVASGGHEVVHTSPVGGRTRYTVSEDGEVGRVERSDLAIPEVMTVEWHPDLRRPSRIRAFDGSVRRFPTWVDDDPTTIVEPSGNTLLYTYAPDAVNHASAVQRPVSTITDDLGPVLSVAYDPTTGLPVTRTNGEGETTAYAHVGDNLVETTSPWGDTTEILSFGAAGHWREATVSTLPEVAIRRKFDLVGNPVIPAAGLQRGGVLEQGYDLDRRLRTLEVAATDPNGLVTSTATVEFELRGDGRILAIRRPLGADHEFEYDALGRVVRVCERVLGSCSDTLFEYDASGRRTVMERANGMREEIAYDAYGRVEVIRALRDGVLEGKRIFTWENGLLESMYDSLRDDTRALEYDAAARLTSEAYSTKGEVRLLDYDERSRLVRETFVAPAVIAVGEVQTRSLVYEYDLVDRMTRLILDDGSAEGEVLRAYTIENGRTVRVADGNGNERETLFDPQTSELVGYRMTDATDQVVEQTMIAESVELGPSRFQVRTETVTALAATAEEYWLNRPGSLLEPNGRVGMRIFRSRGWDDGELTHDRRYAWDALSNSADNGAGDVFTYNADRTRLVAAAGAGWSHSYAYDAAGFATSRDALEIAWTATGRVARVGPTGSPLAEASWDLVGGLISVDADGEYREFSWFGGRVEVDPATAGPGWLHVGGVSLPFAGSERRFRHTDFRGNTSLVTNESGSVISHRRYHAFGVDRVHGSAGSGGGLLEQMVLSGFVGGLAAQGLGLSFTGARVLDADTGRFLSPDPILHVINQTTYAVGNPILFHDATGLHEVPADAAAEARFEFGVKAHTVFAVGLIALGTMTATPGFVVVGSLYLITIAVIDATHAANKLSEIENHHDASTEGATDNGAAKSLDMNVKPPKGKGAEGGHASVDFQAVPSISPCASFLAASGSRRLSLRLGALVALLALWCSVPRPRELLSS